jgi:Glycosyl transferase family 2
MKLVMTLLVRDEADIVDAQIAFHLNAGVDFVIAVDHRSQDETREILARYAREGCLRLLREESTELRQAEWLTRLARLAATEHGADWVICSDADEFWWPRYGDLNGLLAAVPERYGLIRGLWRHFVPRPDDGAPFSERMVFRTPPVDEPGSPFPSQVKVAHRAHPQVTIAGGNHDAAGPGLLPLRDWYPIEVLHFPIRSARQWARKYSHWAAATAADPRSHPVRPVVARAVESLEAGAEDAIYAAFAVDDEAVAGRLAAGTLALDTRLQDTLRRLRAAREANPDAERTRVPLPQPEPSDDLAFVREAIALAERDAGARAEARVDALEARLESVSRPLRGGLGRIRLRRC